MIRTFFIFVTFAAFVLFLLFAAVIKTARRVKHVRVGAVSRRFSPGWGCCFRCRTTWNLVAEHSTFYSDDGETGKGCFPLCELCWSELTPAERLPFYAEHVANCLSFENPREVKLALLREWALIERAVMRGE